MVATHPQGSTGAIIEAESHKNDTSLNPRRPTTQKITLEINTRIVDIAHNMMYPIMQDKEDQMRNNELASIRNITLGQQPTSNDAPNRDAKIEMAMEAIVAMQMKKRGRKAR